MCPDICAAINPVSHCATGSATFPSLSVRFNLGFSCKPSRCQKRWTSERRTNGIQNGRKVCAKNSRARNPKTAILSVSISFRCRQSSRGLCLLCLLLLSLFRSLILARSRFYKKRQVLYKEEEKVKKIERETPKRESVRTRSPKAKRKGGRGGGINDAWSVR